MNAEAVAPTVEGGETAEAGSAPRAEDGGKRKQKEKRTHSDRAAGSLRTAKRHLREVTDPAVKAQFTLAEAHVLALLAVADSLNGTGADQD
jgi:hypothetical protein